MQLVAVGSPQIPIFLIQEDTVGILGGKNGCRVPQVTLLVRLESLVALTHRLVICLSPLGLACSLLLGMVLVCRLRPSLVCYVMFPVIYLGRLRCGGQ